MITLFLLQLKLLKVALQLSDIPIYLLNIHRTLCTRCNIKFSISIMQLLLRLVTILFIVEMN